MRSKEDFIFRPYLDTLTSEKSKYDKICELHCGNSVSNRITIAVNINKTYFCNGGIQ